MSEQPSVAAGDKPKAGEARPCKACGMPIEFRNGPDGRLVPMQRVRTVYAALLPLHGGHVEKWERPAEVEGLFVSHFETCPSASSFSKKSTRAGK